MKINPSEGGPFEELKKYLPTEKTKVDLKALIEHLKYVFLEDNKATLVVISNLMESYPQGHWIEDSKKIGPKMQEKALGFS